MVLEVLIEVPCVIWLTPLFVVEQKKAQRGSLYSDQEITHVRCQCLSLQCGSVRIGLVYAGVLCSSRERGALSALEGLVSREKTTRSHKTPDTGGLCTSRLPDSNHEILYARQYCLI
jgi:hypothetical protein